MTQRILFQNRRTERHFHYQICRITGCGATFVIIQFCYRIRSDEGQHSILHVINAAGICIFDILAVCHSRNEGRKCCWCELRDGRSIGFDFCNSRRDSRTCWTSGSYCCHGRFGHVFVVHVQICQCYHQHNYHYALYCFHPHSCNVAKRYLGKKDVHFSLLITHTRSGPAGMGETILHGAITGVGCPYLT